MKYEVAFERKESNIGRIFVEADSMSDALAAIENGQYDDDLSEPNNWENMHAEDRIIQITEEEDS